MRIARILSLAAFTGLGAVSMAGAQDQGKVGITMGYPASIGVLWRVSDKVAIRPELSLSGGSAETSGSSFESESDNWNISTGASVLFYLHKYDQLRTYFSPRFTYSRLSTTNEASGVTNSTTTTTGNSFGGAGLFGAEYSLGNKFAVFGEVGFGLNHTTTEGSSSFLPNTSLAKQTGNTWGSRAGIGVIFFP